MSRAAGLAEHCLARGLQSARLMGQRVLLEATPVKDEIRRRREIGLGAILDRELLRVLFGLPLDTELPRSALNSREARRLRSALPGVVELGSRSVTRLAVAPVRVSAVAVFRRPSAPTVRAISQFGSYCNTALIVPTDDVAPDVMAEAKRLSVSITTLAGESIVESPPFNISRHTPAMWMFLEQVTAALGLLDLDP